MTMQGAAYNLVASAVDNWRDVLVALLAYLAIEIRRDVRSTRDKVLILWRAHMERSPIIPPDDAYTSRDPLQRGMFS